MYCSNCGCELKTSDIFCGNCGQKINKNTEDSINSENTNPQTSTIQRDVFNKKESGSPRDVFNKPSTPNKPQSSIYKGPIEDVFSAKTWMITGLIVNCIAPFVSIILWFLLPLIAIPTIICTIVGMTKVINILSYSNDVGAQYFHKAIKLLRTNYIICVSILSLVTIMSTIIAVIANITHSDLDALFSIIGFGYTILFLYYICVLIWALVQWIRVNNFMSNLLR